MKRIATVLVVFAAILLMVVPEAFATGREEGHAPLMTGNTFQKVQRMERMRSAEQAAAAIGYDYSLGRQTRGSNFIGKKVVNNTQKILGTVKDLEIGPDGVVNYIVLSRAGTSEMGNKLIPIPFSAVDLTASGRGKVIVNVSESELQNAPSFAANHWPDFSAPRYQQELHGYYGVVASSQSNPIR